MRVSKASNQVLTCTLLPQLWLWVRRNGDVYIVTSILSIKMGARSVHCLCRFFPHRMLTIWREPIPFRCASNSGGFTLSPPLVFAF